MDIISWGTHCVVHRVKHTYYAIMYHATIPYALRTWITEFDSYLLFIVNHISRFHPNNNNGIFINFLFGRILNAVCTFVSFEFHVLATLHAKICIRVLSILLIMNTIRIYYLRQHWVKHQRLARFIICCHNHSCQSQGLIFNNDSYHGKF